MSYNNFLTTAQSIFDSFPNEQVWSLGGLKPNRQLQTPEAGYCVVFRYDKTITAGISTFMTKVHAVLPHLLEYKEQTLHSTIGTYRKRDMKEFVPDPAILQQLSESVEKGISGYSQNNNMEFGEWLYNNETIIIPGYPNRDLWDLWQSIGHAFQENGLSLAMGRIMHITTARFTKSVSFQAFEKFSSLMKSAPVLGTTKPIAIDLATWSCDGLDFKLDTYKRFVL